MAKDPTAHIDREEFTKELAEFMCWVSKTERPLHMWLSSMEDWARVRFNEEYKRFHAATPDPVVQAADPPALTFEVVGAGHYDAQTDELVLCGGHPAGPHDSMGETVYCDGSCRS